MEDFDYTGPHTYHLTIVTARRARLLVAPFASVVVRALAESAEATLFDVLSYVVMPDHVHVLVQGKSDEANLERIVQRFKQRTSHQHGGGLWQQSFHDRVVRRDEDVAAIARYVFENPVRAGLVGDADAWPYAGGTLVARPDE